jgi:hypothetical protein
MLATQREGAAASRPSIRAEDLREAIEPDGWLGCRTLDRFISLAAAPVALAEGEADRFFAGRGLSSEGDERDLARELVALDLRAIAHGSSLLLSEHVEQLALQLLPNPARVAVLDDPPQLDHIGLEVFGRLEWYVEVLVAWARRGVLRLSGYRIFPSVQVRKALAYDPQLGEVRIARFYLEGRERTVNLELFEVTQHWRYTVARQLGLFAGMPREGVDRLVGELERSVALPLEPVGHVALEVGHWQTVEAVHRILADPRSHDATTRLYDEAVSYNPGDQSVNTKFVTQSGIMAGKPVFGRIVELISYGERRDRNAVAPEGRGASLRRDTVYNPASSLKRRGERP